MPKFITADHLKVSIANTTFAVEQADKYVLSKKLDLVRLEELIADVKARYETYLLQLDTMVGAHLDGELKIENFEEHSTENNTFKASIHKKLDGLHEQRRLLELAEAQQLTPTPVTPSTPHSSSVRVKYPTLSLVVFSGDKVKWDSWWQSFDSMVHSKSDLDNVTKFNYLFSSLAGEALKTIERHEITAQGYVLAINTLKNKYSDPEAAQRLLVRQLLDLTNPKLNKFELEKFKENVQTLQHKLGLLNIKCSPADWIIKEILIRKLPMVVINFICDKANTLYPSTAELLEFLALYIKRFEIMEKQPSQEKSKDTTNSNDKAAAKPQPSGNYKFKSVFPKKSAKICSMVEKSSRPYPQCIFCSGEHGSRTCNDFSTRSKRIDRLKALKRCIKCCRTHTESECPSKLTPCYHCKGNHHTWLCTSSGVQTKETTTSLNTNTKSS